MKASQTNSEYIYFLIHQFMSRIKGRKVCRQEAELKHNGIEIKAGLVHNKRSASVVRTTSTEGLRNLALPSNLLLCLPTIFAWQRSLAQCRVCVWVWVLHRVLLVCMHRNVNDVGENVRDAFKGKHKNNQSSFSKWSANVFVFRKEEKAKGKCLVGKH